MSAPSLETSENSGAYWVQPTVSGAPAADALRNFSTSVRQSWRAVVTCVPRQPRRTASVSSGIVSSHEQIRILRGRSAILRPGCGGSGHGADQVIVVTSQNHESE